MDWLGDDLADEHHPVIHIVDLGAVYPEMQYTIINTVRSPDVPSDGSSPPLQGSVARATFVSKPLSYNPFSRLPNEIIAWIIYLTIINFARSPPSWPSTLKRHRVLESVCKAWSECIRNTPYLWSNIKTTAHLEKRLQLSKASPLCIDLEFEERENDCSRSSLRRIFEEAHRWREINVTDPRGHDQSLFTLIPSLPGDLPCLERLSFQTDALFSARRGMVSLRLSDTPRLRYLSLSRVIPVAAMPSTLSQLTYLHIGGVSAEVFNYQSLRSLLVCTPLLEALELERIVDEEDNQLQTFGMETVQQGEEIVLSKLASLDLREVHNPVVIPFLHSLAANCLSTFNFSALYTFLMELARLHPSDVLWDIQLLPKITDVIYQNCGPPSEAQILTTRSGYVNVKLGNEATIITSPPSQWSWTIQKVISRLRLSGVPIVLQLDSGPMVSADVVEALTLPPNVLNVRILYLTGSDLSGFTRICDLLSKPFGPSRSWLLAKLEHLRFPDQGYTKYTDVQDLVKNMLRSRNAADGENPPTRLLVHFGSKLIFHEGKGWFLPESLYPFGGTERDEDQDGNEENDASRRTDRGYDDEGFSLGPLST